MVVVKGLDPEHGPPWIWYTDKYVMYFLRSIS